MACNSIRENFIHINKINCMKHRYDNDFNKDRKYLRDLLIDLFKSEDAGLGKGDLSTRVVYCVEQIGDEIIYLKRPAPLNKGFDFEVHTKSKLFFGRVKTRPSHNCIKKILTNLKNKNTELYQQTQKIITEIYNCNESKIDTIKDEFDGIKIEIILKCIKWLFIEQDITYWSYSGRTMLYNGLKNV